KAIDWQAAGNSYTEFVGNMWANSSDYRIFYNGIDLSQRASIPVTNGLQRAYIRDRQHGELKQNIPERNVWVDHNASQSNDWRIDTGKHLRVVATTSGDVQISRRASWRGLRFTVHFEASVTLKHGNDY